MKVIILTISNKVVLHPVEYSVGIKSVLVNGHIAYKDDIVNTEHRGKIIRDNND